MLGSFSMTSVLVQLQVMALHKKMLINNMIPKSTPKATQSQVNQVGLADPIPP